MGWTTDSSVINVTSSPEQLALLDPETYLTIDQITALTKLGKATIYREMKYGRFPLSIKVSGSARWLRQDLITYLMARVVERNERMAAKKNCAGYQPAQ